MAEQVSQRLPPMNREAEQAVLGAMLRENALAVEIQDTLSDQDFYFEANRTIFVAIVSLYSQGAVDLVILSDHLVSIGQLDQVGGYGYLARLWDIAPTAANGPYYALIVRQKSLLRQLIHVCSALVRDCFDSADNPDDLVARAQRETLEIGSRASRSENRSLSEVLIEVDTEIARRRNNPTAAGVQTGLLDVDSAIGGMRRGELVILAARPSVGKTALAGNIIRRAAEIGTKCLMISLEQSRIELGARWLCGEAQVNSHAVLTGRLSHDQIARLGEAAGVLSPLPIWVNDTPTQKIRNIASAARRLLGTQGLDLVVVDYLQLAEADDKKAQRVQQVSEMTRSLKLLARELDVPVLCLSQLSRNSEQEKRAPRLSDLRESGSIEQDADTVFFLHRPLPRDPDSNSEVVNFMIEKQRNGPCLTIPLTFLKSTMRFENHAPDIGA